MKTTVELLRADSRISDWKINTDHKQSYELFYVKGKLETVRCTDTCDQKVTIYVDHGEYKGDAQFLIYPSTTEDQIKALIDETVEKALLINNRNYSLPGEEVGAYAVESNFGDYAPADLAATIAKAVFAANTVDNGDLNSVEIFINQYTEQIQNSRGLDKTQTRYSAMVEAIPTYNGQAQSVELYEQYNFNTLDEAAVTRRIKEKLEEVKARYEAKTPEQPLDCDVVLNRLELGQLFMNIASDLHYATVYSHSNLWSKGDRIQKERSGDSISITMCGEVGGSVRSSKFDSDGMSLGSIRIIEDGKAVNYYGSNRYGQYLNEVPTGDLSCMQVAAGTASEPDGAYLEVVSMSGLQVDFFNDYIGGEIRLAYYHDGEKKTPVTGISISGSASQVLSTIGLTKALCVHGGYAGPEKAILKGMKIF